MGRPTSAEYAEFYSSYIERVPEESAVTLLRPQALEASALLGTISVERWGFRYAPDKWSIAELVGHMIDTEWVFATRALWFARGATVPLPGMDQDEFVEGAGFDEQAPDRLLAQFETLRLATAALFESFDSETLERGGVASDCRFTVRAISFILVGHVRHHLDVLRDRYLR